MLNFDHRLPSSSAHPVALYSIEYSEIVWKTLVVEKTGGPDQNIDRWKRYKKGKLPHSLKSTLQIINAKMIFFRVNFRATLIFWNVDFRTCYFPVSILTERISELDFGFRTEELL